MLVVPLIIGIMGLKTDSISFTVFCLAFASTFGFTYCFTTLGCHSILYRYTPFFVALGVATSLFLPITLHDPWGARYRRS